MKRLIVIAAILVVAGCGREPEPEPVTLESLLHEKDPALPPSCTQPLLELRLDNWQAFLDQPLGSPDGPRPRRLLRRWVPVGLLEPGPTAARLLVSALTVGVDAAGTPGIHGLDATATFQISAGPDRTALRKDLDIWTEGLRSFLPGAPEVTMEEDDAGLAVRIRIRAPTSPAIRCTCPTDEASKGSGIRIRVRVQRLVGVAEETAGPLLLWSFLPEELGHWQTVDLAIRPGGEDLVTLRLDVGDGAMADILAQARFPVQPGWDRFLPPATPVTTVFFLHEAQSWTRRISDLLFEKGVKSKKIDPVKFLDSTWQTQLGELLSGPAVAWPIVKSYNLTKWDEGWMVYLQPDDAAELKARLCRVFNLRRYITRPETFRKHPLTVVRYKKSGGKVGGVRFAWYCENAGCWLSRTMGGFDRLFDVEERAASPQAERVRSLLAGDALAFAVLSPRTMGERFHLPEPKKKKKKKKKKGGLSLPSLGDREAIARKVIENAVRAALTELPEDLLVEATVGVNGDAIEVELRGLFRLAGAVATRFLPLL